MIRHRLPFYKIYFFGLLILVTAVLGATGSIYLRKEVARTEERSYGEAALGKANKKMLIPPPLTPSDKGLFYIKGCDADTTYLTAKSQEAVDSVKWKIYRGPNDTVAIFRTKDLDTIYVLPAGNYFVDLIYTKSGETPYKVVGESLIVPPDLEDPDLGLDTAICPNTFIDLGPYLTNASNKPSNATYVWSNGKTTDTIKVNKAGTYWVAVTTPNGCTKVDEVKVTIYGQGRRIAAVWYFGDKAGLDFNQSPPTILSDGKMNTPEGNATMSDVDGKLLFYTNGSTVFNKKHDIMTSGTKLGGDSTSTQSSIIIPWPGNEPYYYVFTTEDAAGGGKRLMYSLVDMKGQAANGEVPLKKNFLYQPTTERLTAYGSGSNYWLISHDLSDVFRVYKIGVDGISGPKITKIGSPHNSAGVAQGSMKVSTDGKHLAVGFGTSVELFDFDSAGNISGPLKLDITSNAYGIEFSPDGSKMYVSQNSPNVLYQYTIMDSLGRRNPLDTIIKYRALVQPPPDLPAGRYGALQIAPDGKIYLAVEGGKKLGVLNNPDGEITETNFFATQDLAPTSSSKLGLPNFVQSLIEPASSPGITHQAACYPSPVEFMGSGYGDRDTYTWTFPDGTTQSGFMLTQVSKQLPVGGPYTITLLITNDCGLKPDTFTDTVTVQAGPDPVALGGPYTLSCAPGSFTTINARPAPVAGETYFWSNGGTGYSINVTQPGTYHVDVVKNGCIQSGDALVQTIAPVVSLGPNQTICQGNSIVLDAGNPGATYSWTKDGVSFAGNINPLRGVNTAGRYIAIVTDPLTSCVGRDTIDITVSPRPLFSGNPTPGNPTCGAANGSILVNPSATNYIYDWRNQSGAIVPPQPADLLPNQRSGLTAGIYRVRVSHPVGCDTTLTVTLNSAGGNPTAANQSIVCGTFSATITVNIASLPVLPPGSYSYSFYNQITNTLIATSSVPSLVVNNAGTYYVTITGGGCTFSVSNIVVTTPNTPLVSLSADPNSCASPRTITANVTPASPLYTYRWKPAGSSIFGAASAINTTSASVSGYYVVQVSDGAACTKDSINVTVNPPFTVTLTNPPPSCESAGTVTVTPVFPAPITPAISDKFTYLWTDAGGFRDFSKVLSVSKPAGTYTYNLMVRNPQTGCSNNTQNVTIIINSSPTDPLASIKEKWCIGETVTLDALNPGATYTWSGPNVTTPNAQSITVSETTAKTDVYGLTVDVGGCKSVFSKKLIFGTSATPTLEDSMRFCGLRNENAKLEGGPNQFNLVYNWSNKNGPLSETTPIIYVQDSGYYYLEIYNKTTGCSSFDTVYVKNECESKIYVPNAFRPNANDPNNKNGKLTVFNVKDVRKFEMTIFNRWGEVILSTTDKNFEWDGKTKKGTNAPMGTYAYTITYYSLKGDTNKKLTQRGSIALIR